MIGGAQWQFVESAQLFGPIGWKLGIDGISLMLIMLSVFLMPICIGASWRSITERVGAVYGRVPAHGNADDRRVCGAGSVAVLHLLRSRADPDVSDHRHLGRREPDLRVSYKFFLYTLLGSVLMLIAMLWMIQQAGTADIPTLLNYDFPAEAQTMAVAGLLCQLCCEDADVAGAHLAARRARSGTDCGFGDPGRRAAEDGRLRLPALLAADVPGGLGAVHLADLWPVDGGGGLHFAGRAGAERYEEADRLFVGRAYGDCDRRAVHLQPARD